MLFIKSCIDELDFSLTIDDWFILYYKSIYFFDFIIMHFFLSNLTTFIYFILCVYAKCWRSKCGHKKKKVFLVPYSGVVVWFWGEKNIKKLLHYNLAGFNYISIFNHSFTRYCHVKINVSSYLNLWHLSIYSLKIITNIFIMDIFSFYSSYSWLRMSLNGLHNQKNVWKPIILQL